MIEKDALQIKIDEAKAQLSEDTKDAISAVDWRASILSMREKRGYSFSQLEDLEIETELVIYGLVPAKDFPKELQNRMHIPAKESIELINDLNVSIFQKIRQELIKITERKIPRVSSTQSKEDENDVHILNNAGIQITDNARINNKEEKEAMPTKLEAREDILTKVENPSTINSIPAQKLSDTFQIPTAQTLYSLNNIPKTTQTENNIQNSSLNKINPLTPAGNNAIINKQIQGEEFPMSKRVDPYRLSPDE